MKSEVESFKVLDVENQNLTPDDLSGEVESPLLHDRNHVNSDDNNNNNNNSTALNTSHPLNNATNEQQHTIIQTRGNLSKKLYFLRTFYLLIGTHLYALYAFAEDLHLPSAVGTKIATGTKKAALLGGMLAYWQLFFFDKDIPFQRYIMAHVTQIIFAVIALTCAIITFYSFPRDLQACTASIHTMVTSKYNSKSEYEIHSIENFGHTAYFKESSLCADKYETEHLWYPPPFTNYSFHLQRSTCNCVRSSGSSGHCYVYDYALDCKDYLEKIPDLSATICLLAIVYLFYAVSCAVIFSRHFTANELLPKACTFCDVLSVIWTGLLAQNRLSNESHTHLHPSTDDDSDEL